MITQLNSQFRLITDEIDPSWILQTLSFEFSEVSGLPVAYWRNIETFREENDLYSALSQLGIKCVPGEGLLN